MHSSRSARGQQANRDRERRPDGPGGHNSALAQKLDRLAERLQQISAAPRDGMTTTSHDFDDRPAPAYRDAQEPFDAYSDDGRYENERYADPHYSEYDERQLDDYTEAFDEGRHAAFDAGWRGGVERGQPRTPAAPPPPAPSQDDTRLSAIMGSLDALDQRMRDAEARFQQASTVSYQPATAQLPAAPGAERRRRDRRAPPTPEEIGAAVSRMNMRGETAVSAPVFSHDDFGPGGAPSSTRIPRRRRSDWSSDAKRGRRSHDKTFNEIRSELNTMRSNMGARQAGHAAAFDRRDAPAMGESDLAHLEAITRKLARSVDQLDPRALHDLRADLSDLRAAMDHNGAARSIRALEVGFGDMLQRLDELSRQTSDPAIAKRLEARVEELSRGLQLVPQVQHVNVLERRLAQLGSRFDEIAGSMDPSGQAAVASRLDELREGVRALGMVDVSGRLEGRLSDLARQISSVETVAREARGFAADLYSNGRGASDQLAERLFDEINHLRQELSTSASAQHSHALEARISDIADKIDQIDGRRQVDYDRLEGTLSHFLKELPTLTAAAQSIGTLDHRIDDLARRMGMAGGVDLSPIEDRLNRLEDSARFIGEAVTNNTTEARLAHLGEMVAAIGDQVRDGGADSHALSRIEFALQSIEAGLNGGLGEAQLSALTGRLEQLQTALDRGPQGGQLDDIQQTLTSLMGSVGVAPQQELVSRLETQISKLGDRVEGLTDIETLTRMEGTIRKLSAALEAGEGLDRLIEVEGRLSTIADRFDGLQGSGSTEEIAALRADIADLRAIVSTPNDSDDALRSEIAALAARMDGAPSAGLAPEQMTHLESQIIGLAERLEVVSHSGIDLQPVEQRLIEIEQHLSAPSANTVELARSAARDAVREVAEEMAAKQEIEPDPAIDELRAQINSLQDAMARGRDESAQTLGQVNTAIERLLTKLDGQAHGAPASAGGMLHQSAVVPEQTMAPIQAMEPTAAFAPAPAATLANEPYELEDFDPIAPPSALPFDDDDRRPQEADWSREMGSLPPARGSLSDIGLKDPFDDKPLFGERSEPPLPLDDGDQPMDAASSGFASLPDDGALSTPVYEPPEPLEAPAPLEPPADGGLKRESVSDLRARLFGSSGDEDAPEPEPKKRSLLGRIRKEPIADVAAAVETDAPTPKKSRRRRAEKAAAQDVVADEQKVTDETRLNGPKLDLDHSSRPDANMLTSDFQPLSPGSGPPNMTGGAMENGIIDDSFEDETVGTYRDEAPKSSLLSRVSRIMGRKSGTVAVAAGTAILVAGAMQMRVAIEEGQFAALLDDGPLASAVQQTAALDNQDMYANVLDSTIVPNGVDPSSIDDIITGATQPNTLASTPTASQLAPTQQPAFPGAAGGVAQAFDTQAEELPAAAFTKDKPADTTSTASLEIPTGAIAVVPTSAAIESGGSVAMAVSGEAPLPPMLGTQALQDAAYSGDPDAQFQVGYLLLTGQNVQADAASALSWLEKAAAKDHAPAQFQLGLMHKHGKGTTRDPALAQAWFKRAAENGNVMAMHALAVAYSEGAAGAPDYGAAAKWFERAANYGVKDSQFNIALINARGLGINQDLPTSYKWFAIAAKQGDADAGDKRDTIASKLNRQELAAAKLAVDTWQRMDPIKPANTVDIPKAWQTTATAAASPQPATPTPQSSQSLAGPPSPLMVQETQRLLTARGYNTGGVDGRLGPRTEEAIRAFQRDSGMDETGTLSPALLRQLLSLQT